MGLKTGRPVRVASREEIAADNQSEEHGGRPVLVGLHFLRKRKSGLLCGVGKDAAVLAELIADRLVSG